MRFGSRFLMGAGLNLFGYVGISVMNSGGRKGRRPGHRSKILRSKKISKKLKKLKNQLKTLEKLKTLNKNISRKIKISDH